MSQASLAEALDCEVSTISRYERGDNSPDGEQLIKLANLFDVSPMDFLPAEKDVRWQTVCELRSKLIDLVYRIDEPALLERLIEAARPQKRANLR